MQQLERTIAEQSDSKLAVDLEILHGICHAFGSSSDLTEACGAVTRWVREALPDGPAGLAIFLCDPGGRLDPLAGQTAGESALTVPRQTAFRDRKPLFLHLDHPDRGVAMFPLVCRGDAVGLIQVTGRPATVLRKWNILDAISSQFAMVVKNIEDRHQATKDLAALEQATGLMQEMVKVSRPADAVRAVMDACHNNGYQVAAWLSEVYSDQLRFLGVRGLGKEGRNNLRSQMGVIELEDFCKSGGRERVAGRFAAAVGAEDVVVLGTQTAALALAGVPQSEASSLQVLERLLEDVLDHVGIVHQARQRAENLDLGLAWAVHEIRQPIVSVKMFVDRLLHMPALGDEERMWLSNSFQEMDRLIRLIEDVVRWSVGGEKPNTETMDLRALVQGVVRSFDAAQDRLSSENVGPVIVVGDKERLSAAIRNLIVNALSYSPGRVEVSVVQVEKDAVVSVRDFGPGISPSERRRVFDPFVRGEVGLLTSHGSGLGLFIARQVAKAHHGAIWLESNGKGSVFKIRLPAKSV